MTVTSKGASRRATADPTEPYPRMSTRLSASPGRNFRGSHSPFGWAVANSSKPRCEASTRPTPSSAVAASCTPWAFASATCSGTTGSAASTPAESSWTSRTDGLSFTGSICAGLAMYGATKTSTSSSGGGPAGSHTRVVTPSTSPTASSQD